MKYIFYLGRFADPKIIKFLGIGIVNTIFGYSVYAALLFIKTPYLVALSVATIAGVVFNYFSFGGMVFNCRGGWSVFGKFVMANVLIYTINAVLLSILKTNFILNLYIGQIICIPISVLLSWLLMNYWVYKND